MFEVLYRLSYTLMNAAIGRSSEYKKIAESIFFAERNSTFKPVKAHSHSLNIKKLSPNYLDRSNFYFMKIIRRMASISANMSSLRMKYLEKKQVFLEENIKVKEPICLLKEWMETALNTEEIIEGNAACLATVNKDGFPSNRFVLVKEITPEGLIFFTNYGSRKAQDILSNPNVAITFYWCPLRRSVRIEGEADKISHADSLNYFHQRPRASQIGALASAQSTVIESRKQLDEVESKIKTELGTKEVPMPNWGGYLIRPRLVEFWQGQTDRLHDRIRFRRGSKKEEELDETLVHHGEKGWVYERLAP